MDRDGVINRVIIRNGKPYSPRQLRDFKLTEGIKKALQELKRAGFLLIVVTNQPDVARGFLDKTTLDKFHDLIHRELPVDDIFVCLHDDSDRCGCRKPKPGMLLAAARKWDIDLKNSFLIGATWQDREAARAAGCKTILLDAIYNQNLKKTQRVKGLGEALKIILKSKGKKNGIH